MSNRRSGRHPAVATDGIIARSADPQDQRPENGRKRLDQRGWRGPCLQTLPERGARLAALGLSSKAPTPFRPAPPHRQTGRPAAGRGDQKSASWAQRSTASRAAPYAASPKTGSAAWNQEMGDLILTTRSDQVMRRRCADAGAETWGRAGGWAKSTNGGPGSASLAFRRQTCGSPRFQDRFTRGERHPRTARLSRKRVISGRHCPVANKPDAGLAEGAAHAFAIDGRDFVGLAGQAPVVVKINDTAARASGRRAMLAPGFGAAMGLPPGRCGKGAARGDDGNDRR